MRIYANHQIRIRILNVHELILIAYVHLTILNGHWAAAYPCVALA